MGPRAEGAPVASGDLLLAITDLSTLSLRAEVDETDILLVRPGLRADVELDAVPGATYAATVRSVDVQATPSSRGGVTYAVQLSLGGGRTAGGERTPPPRPGMSAVADLQVRTAKDAVSVPVAAVVRDDDGRDSVWVVEGGVARARHVQLGAQGESAVAVTSGLREGERVVVSGTEAVREGKRVGAGG
jgi:RND family efflux transporter MFP subunit